jgi:hypothetical protein
MKAALRRFLAALDVLLAVLVYPAAFLLGTIRRVGVRSMPHCKRALLRVGVFPIVKHYYEPLFDARALPRPLSEPRALPGLDLNVPGQLALLDAFDFNEEMPTALFEPAGDAAFRFGNGAFESGDAEFLYNLVRLRKPRRIVEIGSGSSTLVAIRANRMNQSDALAEPCRHICIEPYEMPWLESTGVTVVRQRVEDVDRTIFAELEAGDLLFIDSSHVIRPQGDVLFEYLELLPSLASGVLVHVHDIFTPRDYPASWIVDEVKFWNEQYLLEAFLISNDSWRVLAALNYLHHDHHEALAAKCPFLTEDSMPGSFYIQKTR